MIDCICITLEAEKWTSDCIGPQIDISMDQALLLFRLDWLVWPSIDESCYSWICHQQDLCGGE